MTSPTIGSERAVTLSSVSTSWHLTRRPNGAKSSPIAAGAGGGGRLGAAGAAMAPGAPRLPPASGRSRAGSSSRPCGGSPGCPGPRSAGVLPARLDCRGEVLDRLGPLDVAAVGAGDGRRPRDPPPCRLSSCGRRRVGRGGGAVAPARRGRPCRGPFQSPAAADRATTAPARRSRTLASGAASRGCRVRRRSSRLKSLERHAVTGRGFDAALATTLTSKSLSGRRRVGSPSGPRARTRNAGAVRPGSSSFAKSTVRTG